MKTTRYVTTMPLHSSHGRLRGQRWAWLCALLLLLGWTAPALGSTVAADSLHRPAKAAPETRHNVLKINPLSLAVGQLSVFYEHAFSARLSVVVGYGIGANNYSFGSRLEHGGCTYQRGTVEVRRYWRNQGLRGWYTGPYLRVAQLRESHFTADPPGQHLIGSWQTQQALIWVPGFMIGHQLVTRWFVLDSFAGLQAQVVAGSLNRSNQVVEGMTSAVALRVGLTVGVPFN